jgi:hypothetical protein
VGRLERRGDAAGYRRGSSEGRRAEFDENRHKHYFVSRDIVAAARAGEPVPVLRAPTSLVQATFTIDSSFIIGAQNPGLSGVARESSSNAWSTSSSTHVLRIECLDKTSQTYLKFSVHPA